MNYKKLFGYGALIWVTAYLAATILVVLKVGAMTWSGIVVGIVAAATAAWAGTKLIRTSLGGVLAYSLGWVVIGLILDLFLTVPFTGWQIFSLWSYWVSYALIALLPLVTSKKPL